MKANYTHISICLDMSQSMSKIVKPMKESLKAYLQEQTSVGGQLTVSLTVFSNYNSISTVVNFLNPTVTTDWDLLLSSFFPSGMTALYDGACYTIDSTGQYLVEMSEDERPEKVICLIITDGGENDSKKYAKDDLARRIKIQTEQYNWQFVYLGANQNSMAEATKFGQTDVRNTADYEATDKGVEMALRKMSMATTKFRGASGASASMNYMAEE